VQTPTQLGPYTMVRPLGRGAMGAVYEVVDPQLPRHVALKLLRRDTGEVVEERFWREAEILARIQHPNRSLVITEIPQVLSNRGNALRRLGEHRRAIADFDRALELDPGLTGALYDRALANLARGDGAAAEQDLDRVLRRQPRDASALCERAQARAMRGAREEALEDLRRAIELRPALDGAPETAELRRTLEELRR
jgi:tetratricopeptide (TPR) repeat protein